MSFKIQLLNERGQNPKKSKNPLCDYLSFIRVRNADELYKSSQNREWRVALRVYNHKLAKCSEMIRDLDNIIELFIVKI